MLAEIKTRTYVEAMHLFYSIRGFFRIYFWHRSGWAKSDWDPEDMSAFYWRGF